MTRRIMIGVLLGMLAFAIPAQAAVPNPAPNLSATKQSIEVFESIMTTMLQQTFPDPFAVLEKPKGVYLEGFGDVFSFEVDIATVKRPNPFSSVRSTPEEERRFFNEQFPRLKDVMIKTLAEHGDSLTTVEPDENIALVAQLFSSGFLSRPLTLKTVVVRTTRQNLVDYKAGRLTYEGLEKKLEVAQY